MAPNAINSTSRQKLFSFQTKTNADTGVQQISTALQFLFDCGTCLAMYDDVIIKCDDEILQMISKTLRNSQWSRDDKKDHQTKKLRSKKKVV